MKKERMIIGVITAQVSDTEQKRIISGIIQEAQSENMDVAIISNIYNPNKEDFELSFENKIYDLINSHDLDAIIIVSEVIINENLQKLIKDRLYKQNIPIIAIGNSAPEFSLPEADHINTDDSGDIRELTDHLIEIHNFTDIDILTGPYELAASGLRVDGYRKSLISHNISFNYSKVHYGDFWYNSGEELAEKYISGALRLPQAIICTNDYMAFGMLDMFSHSSINIPEDVTIVGYEYVHQRMYHYPLLTTYRRNRKDLGREAVKNICCKLRGQKYFSSSLKGEIIYGNSCKCGISKTEYCKELDASKEKLFYGDLNLFSQFERMLTECRSMDDYIDILAAHSYLVKGISGMYVCLFENWCELFNNNPEEQDSMTVYTVVDSELPEKHEIYMDKNGFSGVFSLYHTPKVFLLNPIFVARKYLGYIILVYQNAENFDPLFRNWVKSASNALEFLHMKNDISYLTQCQNLSTYHDSVTGMYNREGFSDAIGSSLSTLDDSSEFILIMLRTELFNNSFQFDKQGQKYNIAQETAQAMKMLIINKNEFCGRINENTYVFAGFHSYSANYTEVIADRLNTIMLHQPDYIKEYGINSYVYTVRSFSVTDFSLNKAIHEMSDELNGKIKLNTLMLGLPHFSDFQKARDKIYLNPSEDFSSDETCQQLCISVGYFRNVYKKYFGISYHQDCIRSRISLAKFLLFTTSMSITAVAARCGYDDEKYFMRLFQQNTSFTPNRYRTLFQPI